MPLTAVKAQATQQPSNESVEKYKQSLLNAANLYKKADFDAAIALLNQALALSEKDFGPEDILTGLVLNYLGQNYTGKGQYNDAERVLERAIRIFGNLGQFGKTGMAQAKFNLAEAYGWQADYSRAQPLYEQALSLTEEVHGPESPELSVIINNLAELYAEKADLTRAQQMLERSLAIRLKVYGPNNPLTGIALNNLGGLYEQLGNNTKAEDYFNQALVVFQKEKDPENIRTAQVLNNLGQLNRINDPKRARPLLEKGLAMREKLLGPNDVDVANSLNNLALLEAQDGNLKAAENDLLRALDILQKSLGLAHPYTVRALTNLAFVYLAQGDVKRTVNLMSSNADIGDRNITLTLAAGSEDQKRLYMATTQEGTSANIALHLKYAPDDPDATRLALTKILRRKGRVLDVMSGQLAAISKTDIVGQAMLTRLSSLRSQLSSLAVRGPDNADASEYENKTKWLKEQITSLETAVSERASQLGGTSGSVTIEQVQAGIPEDAALVELVQYQPMTVTATAMPHWDASEYAAYVLHHNGPPTFIKLGDAAKIEAEAAHFRAALRNPRREDFREIARSLDEAVMRPVRRLLGNSRQVLISPDGPLNMVPFGALVDENNHFLIEKYTFSYLTSGRDLLRFKAHQKSGSGPVIVANPLFTAAPDNVPVIRSKSGDNLRSTDFSGHFDMLAGTAGEAEQVAGVLAGATVFTGDRATESAIKQLNAPSILHIATHGFFLSNVKETVATGSVNNRASSSTTAAAILASRENPLLRSGIALTGANALNDGHGDDGILTALEAAGINLRGTHLVVLSACETGVGEVQNGEGVYGLRRALVLAGAESLVMSLWKVDDEATRDLMIDFYKQLRAGKGRAAALQEVQLRLLKSDDYKHPFFWAGFILTGDWTPIDDLGAVTNVSKK